MQGIIQNKAVADIFAARLAESFLLRGSGAYLLMYSVTIWLDGFGQPPGFGSARYQLANDIANWYIWASIMVVLGGLNVLVGSKALVLQLITLVSILIFVSIWGTVLVIGAQGYLSIYEQIRVALPYIATSFAAGVSIFTVAIRLLAGDHRG